MKVAEIIITHGTHIGPSAIGSIGFESLDTARAEFERLKDYLAKHEKRANDLEKTIVVEGINSFTCPGNNIVSIAFCDYARADAALAGVRDAFPNMFKR